MNALEHLDEGTDSAGLAFRDMLFLMVLSLVVIIFLLSFLINPVERTQDLPARTEIVVEAFWPKGTSYDIDLWGMGPDGVAVGWGAHSAGPLLNLERDDRGIINDASGLNYEIMTVRAREPGEYTINLHLYDLHGEPVPVFVDVLVTATGSMGEIYSGQVELVQPKDEVTAVRFSLGDDGLLVPDSVHNLFKSVLLER